MDSGIVKSAMMMQDHLMWIRSDHLASFPNKWCEATNASADFKWRPYKTEISGMFFGWPSGKPRHLDELDSILGENDMISMFDLEYQRLVNENYI